MARFCAHTQDPSLRSILVKGIEESFTYCLSSHDLEGETVFIKMVDHLIEFTIEEMNASENQINLNELAEFHWINIFFKEFCKFNFDFFGPTVPNILDDPDIIAEQRREKNLELGKKLFDCLQKLDRLTESIKMEIVENFFEGKNDAIKNWAEGGLDISLPTGVALSCFVKFNFSEANRGKLAPLFQETIQALRNSPARDELQGIINHCSWDGKK